MENWKGCIPECYGREALEIWKTESGGNGFGSELDAWQLDGWRAKEYGSIEWLGMAWSVCTVVRERQEGSE